MPFIVYDFSEEIPVKPRRKRGTSVRDALTFEVGWRKTVVGWVNLRLIDGIDRTVVNLAPHHFIDFVPEAMSDAVSGVVYLSADQVEELGFTLAREEVIA
ncbi:hypothetical protein [Brevibacillus borstelensis]|uniref:hypothetical protein n=1 Tax=Brevibacillus borstelensis TaxID=45462 RepID=UPI00287FDD3F|nr:hypothetical protein [Brevibacillus borstelensis]WNF06368.1 hypothetical protein RFB14_02700 [Brevibacillus borstelensis]